MSLAAAVRRAAVAIPLLVASAGAQTWRQTAAGLGSSARVLIIGTRPEDEDNALIAWLRLGRHIETGYLALTRGEAGVNVAGNERQAALGVVRTAELLAERERDGAHQYFTRAYDFGGATSDSIVGVAWPHDSLLKDVVSVVRAFRPQVVISLFSDSTERDPTHRLAARLAREAMLAAADSVRFPVMATSLIPPWTVSQLLTRVDSAAAGEAIVSIDVGEFDRASGRSYAEIGAEIRRLQRSQPTPPAPPIGHVRRHLRIEGGLTEAETPGLFGNADTTWARFRGAVPADVQLLLDSLDVAIARARGIASSATPDSLAIALARVAKRALDVRTAFTCAEEAGVPRCPGPLGDLAESVTSLREQATRAAMDAAGIVVDGVAEHELVAAGDSVPVTVTVFNGGELPVVVHRVQANSRSGLTWLVRDSTPIPRDSLIRRSGNLRVNAVGLHWWQQHGLQEGTALHDFHNRRIVRELISGEERIPQSSVDLGISISGIDLPVVQGPIVARSGGAVRGDERHALAGVPAFSVLLERTAEYERANLRVDRLFRVFVSSAVGTSDSVVVTLMPPAGITVDSVRRRVLVPAYGGRSVFFRLRGTMRPGQDSAVATVQFAPTAASGAGVSFSARTFAYGIVSRDYPHIPSQQYLRGANVRLEAVDVRIPPRLAVAYVKGTDDVQTPLGQLQIKVHTLDPSLVSVVDLNAFSTVLIGAGALADDALAGAIPSLRAFMRQGGTVMVLPNGEDIGRSGLLPFPIGFDSVPRRVADPGAAVRVTNAKSALLRWPNAITSQDFDGWIGERARDVPAVFDARYQTVLSMGDPDQPATVGTLLVAPVGKGMMIYSSLSLDVQLAAVNQGAARLFVNLLAAGLGPGSARP